MTSVTLYRSSGRLTGFRVEGHSGYASEGSDIVCAAVTSAVRLAECMLTDVLKLDTDVSVSGKVSDVRVMVRGNPAAAQDMLNAFRLYMFELSRENPRYLKVLEV